MSSATHDRVRLSDVLAAASQGAVTFGHVFAAQLVLVTAGKLRAKKGGVVTTEQISIDASGDITLSRAEPSDEPTSTRTLRDLLESLLQLSTSSTPRLRLCACRMESTGLDLLEAELDGAINNVDDGKRRADVGAVARATRDAIDRGAIEAGAPPSVQVDESFDRASLVPDQALLHRLRKLEEELARARTEASSAQSTVDRASKEALGDAQRWATTAAEAERASSAAIASVEQLRHELRETKGKLATVESNAEARVAKAAAERDAAVAALRVDGDRRIETALGDRDARITSMLEEHAARVASLTAERDLRATEVSAARAERDRKVAESQSLVADRDRKLTEIERAIADRDRRLAEANDAHAAALARLRETSASTGGEEERIQALEKALRSARDDHALAIAAVGRDADSRVARASEERARQVEKARAESDRLVEQAIAELGARHAQTTKAAAQASALRVAEVEAERTQSVTEADKRAAEAMVRLESIEASAKSALQRAIDEGTAAKAAAVAALAKAHEATLAETRRTHEASLREAQSARDEAQRARDAAIETTEKTVAEIRRERDYMVAREIKARESAVAEEVRLRDSVLADASRRFESSMADVMRERTTLVERAEKDREAAVAEAEKKHGKLLDASLAKLRKTIEKETERALADQRLQIEAELASQHEMHSAELSASKARIADLEQGIARAQADRDAERILRLDVESNAAKRMREWRGRSSTPSSAPEESKNEPALPSVPRIESRPTGGPSAIEVKPPVAQEEPSPPPPRMFGAPPVVCQALLTLDNVTKGAEVLRRLGVAPLSATMPMHVPLEIVAMREGSAPRRALVEASASWKTDDIVPRLDLRIPLDSGDGAWPTRTAPLPLASPTEPPRGMLQLTTDPTGAALWLTVDPARIAGVPCGSAVDLLVVAPGAAPKNVRVEWNAFTGAPPRATHKL